MSICNPELYLTSDCPAHSDSFKIVARHTVKSKRRALLWGASDESAGDRGKWCKTWRSDMQDSFFYRIVLLIW